MNRTIAALILGFSITLPAHGATAREASGVYRAPDGRTVALFPAPPEPSQIAMVDVATGEVRVIFPDGDDDAYLFGPALVVPEPVEGRVRLARDGAGEIEALTRTFGDSDPVRFERLALPEEPVTFRNGATTLAGTIILPQGQGPFPGVVMLHGSEPEPREGSLGVAYLFASSGIATLIFDKRGVGESSGDEWRASFDTYAGDAMAAFDRLASHPEIDAKRIGYWGHSQGAWISALAASKTPDAAFCIMECGGAVDVIDATQWWARGTLRAKTDLTEEQIDECLAYRKIKYDLVAGRADRATYDQATEAARDNIWWPYVTERLPDGLFWESNADYDPIPALRGLNHCPVLALYADHDDATPTEPSVRVINEVLAQSGHEDYTIRVFADANHGLFETMTGARLDDEMEQLERFVPGYIELLTSWTRSAAGLSD